MQIDAPTYLVVLDFNVTCGRVTVRLRAGTQLPQAGLGDISFSYNYS